MDIKKQHIILSLINSGRYECDIETGEIYSNAHGTKRLKKPIEHYSGYLQYHLDIGFCETIQVYGQGFNYLFKWRKTYDPKFVIDHINGIKNDNRPENLRCITHRENTKGNFKGVVGVKKGSIRFRLPEDAKQAIKDKAAMGISYTKLAAEYGTTRQTVSTICKVK